MSLGVTRYNIVKKYSAAPIQDKVERIDIKTDYTNIYKFNDFDSPGFETVTKDILRYTRKTLAAVKQR